MGSDDKMKNKDYEDTAVKITSDLELSSLPHHVWGKKPLQIDDEDDNLQDLRDTKRSRLRESYVRTLRTKEILRSPSALASRQHDRVVAENFNDWLPGCVVECETCGGQSLTLQALGGCHGSIQLKPPRITGGHRSLGLHGHISGEGTSTVHNHVSRGTSPSGKSDGLAKDVVVDIPEEGGSCVHPPDSTRPARGFSRLAILADPLFDVNVQGAFALVAFTTGNASSPAKDVLLYLLVFLYVVGFLSAVGGKLFRSSKLQLGSSAATVLGFLLTMVLRLL